MTRRIPAFFCVLFLTSTVFAAANWPQWRGPDRNDLSKETGLLKEWPADGPKLLWTNTDAGLGYSGFAAVGDTLYTMGLRSGKENIIALNIKDGKEKWAVAIGDIYRNRWGDGPRSSPTVDGDHVYAMSGNGDLGCVTTAGKLVWNKSMKALGGSVNQWGYTESVLVDGDKVICTPGGNKGTVAALNKKTGAVIWQSKDLTDPAHYSSTIAIDHGGKRQYVQLTASSIAGFEATTGKMLWRVSFPGKTAVIPTPIYRDGYVFVTAGYQAGCKLIQLSDDNEATEVYSNTTMMNHHGGVILYGDHVYGHSDTEGWLCMDFKTGKKVWNEKRGVGKGAIAYADGMFYCLGERDGTVALIEASPAGWNEKGRFKLDPQSTQRSRSGAIWVHPVITDGKLYLRDQEIVHCYDVSSKAK